MKFIMGILLLTAAYLFSKRAAEVTGMQKIITGRKGYAVVLDPGHGGSDPGKVSASGTEEKELNLQIALRLKNLLETQDVTVYMTRTDDKGVSRGNKKTEDLKKRCQLIHEKQPDCAVSIHQNSYQGTEPSGAQTFYYTGSEEGKNLAEEIQKSLIKRLDPENHRAAKSNSSYYMLKHTDVPITIVECGFLSNPEEERLLKQAQYQEKTAWAIHMGIMNYLNREKDDKSN